MLIANQIVRYGSELYRVEHVNTSRAFLVPLRKKVKVGDSFGDAEMRGISISPNSYIDIVTDIEGERERMELEALEAEVVAAKAELARRAEAEAQAAITKVKQPAQTRRAASPEGQGWHQSGSPTFRPGSLAALVWAFIGQQPGLSTAAIVEGVKSDGAVAACVSRFHQAGLIVKK